MKLKFFLCLIVFFLQCGSTPSYAMELEEIFPDGKQFRRTQQKSPIYYVHQIEPHKEAMEKLSGILKEVSSRTPQIRKKGLEALKAFEKEQKDNQAPKSDCTIL